MYMIVEGMPGTVSSVLECHDVAGSENVKRQILCLYRRNAQECRWTEPVLNVFDTTPSISSSRNKVFRPGSVESTVLMKAYSD